MHPVTAFALRILRNILFTVKKTADPHGRATRTEFMTYLIAAYSMPAALAFAYRDFPTWGWLLPWVLLCAIVSAPLFSLISRRLRDVETDVSNVNSACCVMAAGLFVLLFPVETYLPNIVVLASFPLFVSTCSTLIALIDPGTPAIEADRP